MDKLLKNAQKPNYAALPEKWSYYELKDYFDGISGIPFKMAACSYLSNVEGLGDYFDLHAFFDFQAYLVLASMGLKEDVMFKPGCEEYDRLRENIEYFLKGNCDDWTLTKKDLSLMKEDCKKVNAIYYKGDKQH